MEFKVGIKLVIIARLNKLTKYILMTTFVIETILF